jgi:hypothetical protein
VVKTSDIIRLHLCWNTEPSCIHGHSSPYDFSTHLIGRLVFPQPDVNRVAQQIVGRPGQIGNLGDELRFDPMDAGQNKRRAEVLSLPTDEKPRRANVGAFGEAARSARLSCPTGARRGTRGSSFQGTDVGLPCRATSAPASDTSSARPRRPAVLL